MKKIRCTFGTETVDEALKEVEMYKKFPHRNIIKVLVRSELGNSTTEGFFASSINLTRLLKDTCTTTEPDQTKAVYIFLPFYRVCKRLAITHLGIHNLIFSSWHHPERQSAGRDQP